MFNIEFTDSQIKDLKEFLSRVVLRGSEVEKFMSLVRVLPENKVLELPKPQDNITE